jgi:hypothetical protein
MKLMEADKITTLIMTDDWHSLSGEYDYEENGQYFVIEYNHKAKTVTVHTNNTAITRPWKGTTGRQTSPFRAWLQKTINAALVKKEEK